MRKKKFPNVAQMIELNKDFDDRVLLVVKKQLICTSNDKAVELYGEKQVTRLKPALMPNFDGIGQKVMLSMEIE
ncbi:hypothetical protein GMB80_14480 [Turicibacter sanguinis]|uniref:hypothetical protein n=1 Tax=Turicibacter sanguinis TaxID=154288 RepID=UPI0012BBFE5B|nr:hypothetical protein [Turicibacter sanguinis]MTP74137.1 hypothetical protein [Turicibacter sanguinis]